MKSYSLILHSRQNMTFLVLNHIFLLLQIFSNDLQLLVSLVQ